MLTPIACGVLQVLDCAGKHQVLIFVHSRKETAKTAQYLKQTALDNDHLAKFMRDDSASREILQVGSSMPCTICACTPCSSMHGMLDFRQGHWGTAVLLYNGPGSAGVMTVVCVLT